MTRDERGVPSQLFQTLFLQETIERGFILPSLVVSMAYGEQEIDLTVQAVGEALAVYKRALDKGAEKDLRGPPIKPVYRRHTNVLVAERGLRGGAARPCLLLED